MGTSKLDAEYNRIKAEIDKCTRLTEVDVILLKHGFASAFTKIIALDHMYGIDPASFPADMSEVETWYFSVVNHILDKINLDYILFSTYLLIDAPRAVHRFPTLTSCIPNQIVADYVNTESPDVKFTYRNNGEERTYTAEEVYRIINSHNLYYNTPIAR